MNKKYIYKYIYIYFFSAETFNETMNAFLIANRDGFHLMEVTAAPLLVKRRGLKRKSGNESVVESNKKSTMIRCELESVPEAVSPEMTRPDTLTLGSNSSLMEYRTPKPPTIRDTRDSD